MNRNITLIVINLIFIFLLYPPSSFAQEMKAEVNEQQIDSLFKSWDDLSKPGIVLGVLNNGKIEHLKAYGSANLEHSKPINTETKFLFDGLSDQMIAYATLLLSANGSLSLEDHIDKYIDVPLSLKQKIKVKHLLSHNSGLEDLNSIKSLAGWANDHNFEAHQVQTFFNYLTLNEEPGKSYKSNRFGMKILQDIIEKTSKLKIEDYMQQNIFNPLGMKNSIATRSSSLMIPNRATPYSKHGENYHSANITENHGLPFMLYTTAEDVCKWAKNFKDVTIGSKEIHEKFDSFAKVDEKTPALKNQNIYLGQHQYWDFKGVPKLYLIGQKDAYAAKLIRFPAQDLAIVVLGNAGAYNGHWTSFTADLYLEKYYKKSNTEENKKDVVSVDSEALKAFTGTYWDPAFQSTFSIEVKTDTLRFLEIESGWGGNLLAYDKSKFFVQNNENMTLVFENNDPSRLSMHSPNGGKYPLIKFNADAPWTKSYQVYVGDYSSKAYNIKTHVKLKGDQLYFCQEKKEDILLIPINKECFKTEDRTFREVKFIRDKHDEIEGLSISNPKIKNFKLIKNVGSSSNAGSSAGSSSSAEF